jgi:hypothetical protein
MKPRREFLPRTRARTTTLEVVMPNQYTHTCQQCNQPFLSEKREQTYCRKGCATSARWSRRSVDNTYWPRIDRTGGAQACWLWQEGCDRDGYGKCRVPGFVERRAHRISYMLKHGHIPDGLWVLHTCDTPRCCNPAHLFLGTVADNNADMIAKGREARGDQSGARKHPERVPRGHDCHSAKLTDAQVEEARRQYATGLYRQVDLAAIYGVSQTTIGKAIRGASWKHVA